MASRRCSLYIFVLFALTISGAAQAPAPKPAAVRLPLHDGSVRFALIGDGGTGERGQYEVGKEMARFRDAVSFNMVLMVGDNIYGSPDFKKKFEAPYEALLASGVKFFAALGNHDNPNQRMYKLFNMDGRRYYNFTRGPVEFFALDSTYMDPEQLNWIEGRLAQSGARWKICFFHHPLYSNGKRHGPSLDLRARLQPLFEKYDVDIVFSGHEHFYERHKPRNGVHYFILGNSGKLRAGNIKLSADTLKGFDTDLSFGMFEITADTAHFQVVSRTGQTVDFGAIERKTIAP